MIAEGSLLTLILGALLLFLGRPLFWLTIAILGFLVGMQLASELLIGQPDRLQLFAAVAAGLLGAAVTVVFRRLAFAVGGFLAGGYLAMAITDAVIDVPAAQTNWTLLWFVIGGILGAVIAAIIMDYAIIALTSLAGAGAIVSALEASASMQLLLLIVLTLVGFLIQRYLWLPSAKPREGHSLPS